MIELYFLCYRVPKMMARAARERGRSPVAWVLMAIGLWLGVEIVVLFAIGVVYGVFALVLDWGEDISPGMTLISYMIALIAALLSVSFLQRYLFKSPQKIIQPPPPPPTFERNP